MPVDRLGHHRTGSAGNRFGDHRGDSFRAVELDQFLDGRSAFYRAVLARGASQFAAVGVGLWSVGHSRRPGFVVASRRGRIGSQEQYAAGGTMVGASPADQAKSSIVAASLVIGPGDFQRGFVGQRSTADREGAVERSGSEFGQLGGQPDRGRIGRSLREVGDLFELFEGGFGNLGPAVADVCLLYTSPSPRDRG